MNKTILLNRVVSMVLAFSLGTAMVCGLAPQGVSGGASAFQGQDIMGGASVVFKRPQRVRDIVGGAAALMVVKRSPKPPARPTEVARNNPPDRRRPRPRPGETPVEPTLTDADKGEAFKNQGNTYYDLGDFPKAIEAYLNALKHTPKDAVIYNNLGAAYFSSNKNSEAAAAFKKSLVLKPGDADAFFNLGIASSSIDDFEGAVSAFKDAVKVKPDWAEAYNALGDSYLSLSRYAEAV